MFWDPVGFNACESPWVSLRVTGRARSPAARLALRRPARPRHGLRSSLRPGCLLRPRAGGSECTAGCGSSGGPHRRFLFGGEGSLWILGLGAPSSPNPSSGHLKSTLPGPREGSSIKNVDLVIVTAAVQLMEPQTGPKSTPNDRRDWPPTIAATCFLGGLLLFTRWGYFDDGDNVGN